MREKINVELAYFYFIHTSVNNSNGSISLLRVDQCIGYDNGHKAPHNEVDSSDNADNNAIVGFVLIDSCFLILPNTILLNSLHTHTPCVHDVEWNTH